MSVIAEKKAGKRDQWLKERSAGIGASEAPAVLGVSPWATALDVWAEKTGIVDGDRPESRAMVMGHRLERIVADEYRAKHAAEQVINPGRYAIQWHPEGLPMFATLDRVIARGEHDRGILEIKTTGERWASDWEIEPPLHVQVQVQHQLACTGLSWGVVAVLIGGRDYREFDVSRDDQFIKVLTERELAFWRHVQEGTRPAAGAADAIAVARSLAKLHPEDNGESVELADEFLGIDARLAEISAELDVLTKEREELRAKLQVAIGENTFGILPDGTQWSWKTQETKGYEVGPRKSRVLRRKGGKR